VTEAIHTTREIQELIPHRWPFLLVDRIDEYDPEARRIVGRKAVTATEWFFQGHFPGMPVMPGVLQVEALAQTMAVFVAKQEGFGTGSGSSRASTSAASTRREARRRPPPGGHDGQARPALRARSGRGQRGRRGLLRGHPELRHPRRLGAALMTRLAVFSDIHGVSQALDAVRDAIAAAAPDVIAVAGDYAVNGPDPAAVIDGIRELETRGALVVAGNTDIAVADSDYGAAYPWLGDGVPESTRSAVEWAHEAIGQSAWTGCAGCPPSALPSRRRHAGPRDARVARLPDGRLRPRLGRERPSWSAWAGPTPGSSAAATPTSPRSATSAGRWWSTRAARIGRPPYLENPRPKGGMLTNGERPFSISR